jgi:hypothetical protein
VTDWPPLASGRQGCSRIYPQIALLLRWPDLRRRRLVTRARQAERARSQARRKFIGYATGSGGCAFAMAGAALLGWNSSRYDDWRCGRTTTGAPSQLQTVASIQRVDDMAFGCAALGAGLIATSAWLLMTGATETDD